MTTMTRDDLVSLIRAKRRRDKFWRAVGRIAVGQLTHAIASLMDGWFLMLGVGVIHARWITALPTVGYWWAVLVVWLLKGVLSRATTAKKDDD